MLPYLTRALAFAIPILSNGGQIANAFSSINSSRISCSYHYHAMHTNISMLHATMNVVSDSSNDTSRPSSQVVEQFLSLYESSLQEGQGWATEFGFSEQEAAFYAIFRAIRKLDSPQSIKLLGLNGTPFYIPRSLLAKAEGASWDNGTNRFSSYFHFSHLAAALEEDFLDAQVGSTDNRLGWKVSAVSEPTGSSFDDARMTLSQVKAALASGTVIFNNIGAHIPRLAGPALASTDALSLPGAVNMYVTAKGMRTSAPPHTDRQDVLVVQMEGAKRWRVFTPPTDGDVKPNADPFARGKGLDNLPLHTLLEGTEGRLGSELLMDVTLREGDVLFIPAGFPHTTDTVEESRDADYEASIHLTFNIDTHVWGLDNLTVRNVALRRSGIKDILASPPSTISSASEANLYVGKVNQLPDNHRSFLLDALPLDFLDMPPDDSSAFMSNIARDLEELCSNLTDPASESTAISSQSLKVALERMHSYGSAILDIHRDMYVAAVEEGRLRETEAAMTAHISGSSISTKVKMNPERIQRLSLFRVRPYFEKINEAKAALEHWCVSGSAPASNSTDSFGKLIQLDPNWQFTAPLAVGDECEADLGGVFFAAKISQIVGNNYNVVFFDGDRADGLERSQIKLSRPPTPVSNDVDTTGLTKKEIKRLMKKKERQ